MSNDKAVMQQALDALEKKISLTEEIRSAGRPPHADFWCQSIAETDMAMRQSITALEAAIAQPEQPAAQHQRTEAEIVALAFTFSGSKYCPERSGEVAFKYDQLQAFAAAIAQPVQPKETK